ncbi:hypothetical protein BGZ82_002724 [Podila clonocystis]|nr:hypothetical protein BGZ82_002724 [Podila clonocystis]
MALPRSHSTYSQLNGEDTDHDEDPADSRKKGLAGEQVKSKSAGDDDDDDDAAEDNDLEINIRFGEGQDLSLRVPRTDTIATMKEKIKEARPTIGNKYLRLIHSGKILTDDKPLIDSLPKSLFTQVEVPKAATESTLTRIVSTVEAAASSTLTGIASRASMEEKSLHLPTSRIQTHTSRGSILPTHVSHHGTVSSDPLSSTAEDHVSITITSDPSSPNNNNNTKSTKTKKRRSTVMIPVQTGPIYFLCSLSDHPPAQPQSAAKKGKAVARGSRVTRNTPTTPSSSTAASSSLTLPGQGNGSSRTRNTAAGDEEEEEDDNEEPRDGELSPIMVPQPTGFDRLREAGFSEEEIRSIRRQFHASRGTTTVGENGIEGGLDQDEDAAARARRIEEEWIDQHGAETLPDGLEGSYGEMVWGLMLGFFMGLIALFWFKEATFSRRHQMGIVAGLMINVGFGVLHLYY